MSRLQASLGYSLLSVAWLALHSLLTVDNSSLELGCAPDIQNEIKNSKFRFELEA
jgi:hypothetical protein